VTTYWAKRAIGALMMVIVAISGLLAASAMAADPDSGLHATIRRTSHGIPHILANDYGSLGFGYGVAAAEDNICVLADIYVTVNGERSRFSGSGPLGTFGPTGQWSQGGNSATPHNLNSDFFFQRIKDRGTIENLLSQPPPVGPLEELKEGVRGYVHGYNKYLRDTGVDNLPDAGCRGKPWVREITEMDAYRRFYQLGLIASQGVVIDGIGGAAPTLPGAPAPLPTQSDFAKLGNDFPFGGLGSNAVALGPDATANGKGMLLGNPHFPWDGSERFYESHLTIPGEINVEGGSLIGVPIINIGHTDNLAWSHTVSTARRFTGFELTLVPGDPYSYFYDGQIEHMSAENVAIQVRNPDGSLSPQTRTLYSTQPHAAGAGGGYSIFTEIQGLPLPWTPTRAFAMGDANAGNFRYLNHFFEVNDAQSVDAPGDDMSLVSIIKRYQGVPWVNTIASDRSGDAYYADISVTPKVTNEQADACNTETGQAAYNALRVPILDGSISSCEWASPLFGGPDPDAVDPSTFGPSNMPSLHPGQVGIRDYVTNSNDSYWLSNPEHPLEGYDLIIGDERTQRALRTRSGLEMVDRELGGPSGSGTFTRQELQDMVFANEQYAGQLWRDDLADFCKAAPGGQMIGSSGPVNVSAACPVLRNWDVHDNLDSNGAVLFRVFAQNAIGAVPVFGTPGLFVNQFDASDPVHTPNGLNVGNPQVERAFADAVKALNDRGIPLDAKLRDYQSEQRNADRIPIHGGPGGVGVFNAINVGLIPGGSQGWTSIPHGSSFVMVASFTDDACPNDTRTILTYSQSTNPASPWYSDQTQMFSNKQWVDEAFCESEILADPNLVTTTVDEGNGYARPASATPVTVKLVPAFEACAAADSTHGAPLAVPSCNPPSQTSHYLTVGAPDVNGRPASASGVVTLKVVGESPINPGNGDQSDIQIGVRLTDVRNASDLTDYTGELSAVLQLRITDRDNGLAREDPATLTDAPLKVTVPCSATSGSEGGTCNIATTADAVTSDLVKEGQRAVWELGQIKVFDGGADGDADTNADNTLFAVQGTFAP
jgi:acyl-homoserine-lactone acylase